MPGADDDRPLVGKVPGLTGLYVAAGHYCWGILQECGELDTILRTPSTVFLLTNSVSGHSYSYSSDLDPHFSKISVC